LVSPPWQHARSHITRCLTIPDFQKHYSDSLPPYSPDLTPCQLYAGLEDKEDVRGGEQRGGGGGWIAVYIPEGATSTDMAETRNYGKKLFFYGQIPRIFG
jgi:hypothetical protein